MGLNAICFRFIFVHVCEITLEFNVNAYHDSMPIRESFAAFISITHRHPLVTRLDHYNFLRSSFFFFTLLLLFHPSWRSLYEVKICMSALCCQKLTMHFPTHPTSFSSFYHSHSFSVVASKQ